MDNTKYTDHGRMMTGFNSGNERSFYGHWSNPEYQEDEMFTNMSEQEYKCYLEDKNKVEIINEDDENWFPF